MVDLKLVGLNPDGERLTLSAPNGEQFTLEVTDELRAAVRRDRPLMEQIRAADRPVRPREIQSMLRAGSTVVQVSEISGLPVEHIQRYEGPVLAERAWVIQQALLFPIGHSADSPSLGDLVVDRLATRRVREEDLEWSAVRSGAQPWELAVVFSAGGKTQEARWEVDLSARVIHALNDEARWLSETDMASPRARRFALPAAIPEARESRVYNVEDDGDMAESGSTDSLLAQLHSSRGVRQQLAGEDEDLLADFLEPPDLEIPAAHPPASDPDAATDARVLPLPVRPAVEQQAPSVAEESPTVERTPKRRNRRSVPSWDEIVFGSKGE